MINLIVDYSWTFRVALRHPLHLVIGSTRDTRLLTGSDGCMMRPMPGIFQKAACVRARAIRSAAPRRSPHILIHICVFSQQRRQRASKTDRDPIDNVTPRFWGRDVCCSGLQQTAQIVYVTGYYGMRFAATPAPIDSHHTQNARLVDSVTAKSNY